MLLGLDLGSSGLKAILVDEEGSIIAAKTCALTVQRPAPGWSEQAPANWWAALLDAVDSLKADYPKELAAVRAIGLSGQMHGAVLLDAADQVFARAFSGTTPAPKGNAATLNDNFRSCA